MYIELKGDKMKQMSKLFAIIISFVILISAFVMPVSAADVNYSVTSASGKKGDTVTVSVKISSSVQLWASNVSLSYNSSELQYVSSSKGNVVTEGSSLHPDGSSINFSGMYIAKSGTVFTVKFKILKESGTSTLTLTSTENIDSDGKEYTPSVSNGKITIAAPEVAVSGISLDKTTVSLKKGETTTLKATVTPSNATNKTVTYTSSNTKVATVDSSGKVTAVGGGKATITAKAGGKTATCTVTVNVAQTGIKASGNTTRTVSVGDTINLSVVKVPEDATDNYTTNWTSSDTKIATVTSNGAVKALAVGTVEITAKANNWTVVYKITINEKTEESTTVQESTSVEESTSEETTEFDTTEEMTYSETETTEKYSLVEPSTNFINPNDGIQNTVKYKRTFSIVCVAVFLWIILTVVGFILVQRSKGKNGR